MSIITIPQIDGTRLLALSATAATVVHSDPAMIDYVSPKACLDIPTSGQRRWSRPHGCADSAAGRTAIRRWLR